MATIKHTSSKNSDLSAAERYLIFQHNEYTGLPILDERGRPKLRENYILDTLECGENTFAMACLLANRKYGKNAQAVMSKPITISSALTREMQQITV